MINKMHNELTEEDLKDYVPVHVDVCKECLDCCSDMVPFELSTIKKLKKQHKKLFRGTKLVPHLDVYYIKNKTNKCIFLKNKECIIYDQRPDICKYFGSSPISRCGLEGLTQCPPKEERKKISGPAHLRSFRLIEEISKRKEFNNAL